MSHSVKRFADLTEREVLAVAISSEEEDSRIYMAFAEDLAGRYPDSAKIFEQMAEEETGHRHRLLELYEQRFGPHLPPIRRENVRGFLRRRPIWLTKNLSLDTIRKEVETMEFEAERFYVKAAEQAEDVGVRRLLGDLAEAEQGHEKRAAQLTDRILSPSVRANEDKTRRRMFVLQYVQPGLAGLMDGSVSTLAPLFAAAFATHHNWQTFLVGLAASVTRCPIWCPTPGRTHSGSRPELRASSCSSNCGRSPSSARTTWTRRSCRRCSRSCSAASSCSPSVF